MYNNTFLPFVIFPVFISCNLSMIIFVHLSCGSNLCGERGKQRRNTENYEIKLHIVRVNDINNGIEQSFRKRGIGEYVNVLKHWEKWV